MLHIGAENISAIAHLSKKLFMFYSMVSTNLVAKIEMGNADMFLEHFL